MASTISHSILVTFFVLFSFCLFSPSVATTRKLSALVQEQPLVLKYHNGLLLKGEFSVNLIWYGKFTPAQHAVVVDFIQSLSSPKSPAPPSVSSWWKTTERYKAGPTNIRLGKQLLDESCSLGKSLKSADLPKLAARAGASPNAITAVLTAADVFVEGFCMSRCGTHGSASTTSRIGGQKAVRFTYVWVGNPAAQCPGMCAWPFHQPMYGPQTPPLVAPNGDVGVDGMVINLATVLAATATNPYNNGFLFFQGPATAPLEAVSACTGMFGSGSYPGYPGTLLVDGPTGASYNAHGLNGRKYLLPAMWDPKTSACSTLV